MTDLVVDASAVGAALLRDETTAFGDVVREVWKDSSLRVPVHWPIEVCSIFVKAERDQRITSQECEEGWILATALIRAASVETSVAAHRVFQLSRLHGLTAQDAAYLDLAMRIDAPLLTGDKRLALACAAVAVKLPFDPNA